MIEGASSWGAFIVVDRDNVIRGASHASYADTVGCSVWNVFEEWEDRSRAFVDEARVSGEARSWLVLVTDRVLLLRAEPLAGGALVIRWEPWSYERIVSFNASLDRLLVDLLEGSTVPHRASRAAPRLRLVADRAQSA